MVSRIGIYFLWICNIFSTFIPFHLHRVKNEKFSNKPCKFEMHGKILLWKEARKIADMCYCRCINMSYRVWKQIYTSDKRTGDRSDWGWVHLINNRHFLHVWTAYPLERVYVAFRVILFWLFSLFLFLFFLISFYLYNSFSFLFYFCFIFYFSLFFPCITNSSPGTETIRCPLKLSLNEFPFTAYHKFN